MANKNEIIFASTVFQNFYNIEAKVFFISSLN